MRFKHDSNDMTDSNNTSTDTRVSSLQKISLMDVGHMGSIAVRTRCKSLACGCCSKHRQLVFALL